MTEKPSRKTNSIILTFTGDTSSSGIFDQIVRSNTCLEDPIVSSDIIDFFRLGDEVIVNLEGPITDKPCSKTKGSCVSSSPAFARVLRALGVTVLNLANNHMTDCGIEGLADTLSIARDNGMYTVGAGADLDEASRPLVLERKGISVALIATTHFEGITATNNSPGVFCAEKDFSLARSIIADIKNRYDWVVMNYHGGEEYVHIPMPRRRRLMRRFLDLGVDVIICHHPHVVQGYEQFGDKIVFYSLGNFMFDTKNQRKRKGTEESVVVKLSFLKSSFNFETRFTLSDKSEGTLTTSKANTHFRKLDLQTYKSDWRKECFRVISSRESHGNAGKNPMKTVTITPKGPRLLTKISSAIRILSHRNARPIYIGALQHIALRRVFRRGNKKDYEES